MIRHDDKGRDPEPPAGPPGIPRLGHPARVSRIRERGQSPSRVGGDEDRITGGHAPYFLAGLKAPPIQFTQIHSPRTGRISPNMSGTLSTTSTGQSETGTWSASFR